MDKILNINPSDLPMLSATLPSGLHAPQQIVGNHVDYEGPMVSSPDIPQIPDEAQEKLEKIARDSIDNVNVILVDDKVRICNMKPSADPEKDYTAVQAFVAAGLSTENLTTALPSSVDLREDWWAVKDQGSTGACAGFSASSLCEYVFVKTGRLSATDLISPRSLWQAAKETDSFVDQPTTFIEQEGTSLTAVLKVAQKWGMVREKTMPFNTLYSKSAQAYYLEAARLRISTYYNLGKNPDTWKKWLAQYGPIYTAITVDSTWENATQTKGKLTQYNANQIYGGHAVLLCGYDTQKDQFIFKNSWGKVWGDQGYAYATTDWCMKAVLETYGIAV